MAVRMTGMFVNYGQGNGQTLLLPLNSVTDGGKYNESSAVYAVIRLA